MSRPAHSKNPVHDVNHPHHIPHIASHNGGKFDPHVAAKAVALEQVGVLKFEPVAEYAESDSADILVVRRIHTGKS